MKNILYLLIFASFSCFAQQKPKPQSKPNVPIIKDDPKPNVPLLTDADDDLLPIHPNEPKPSELLDVVSAQAEAPKTPPNAGTHIHENLGLQSNFSFNKRIGFMAASPDGDMVGHFFLNTKNGYALLPYNSVEKISEGEVNQILTPFSELITYTKGPEGSFVMKMSSKVSSQANHDWISKEESKNFFTTFKKTGKVGSLGARNQFKSVEYVGKDDKGKTIYVYLAASPDIKIDTRNTHSLTGFFGLGYVASPSKRTYLIIGISGAEGSAFMTSIENASYSFAGKNYKPVGEMAAAQYAENLPDLQAGMAEELKRINEEEDPQLRQLMMEQFKQLENLYKKVDSDMKDFSKSSDVNDMPLLKDSDNPKAIAEHYDMQIKTLQISIRQAELRIRDALKAENYKAAQHYTCMKNCYLIELNRIQKAKAEHLQIMNQYKNNEEKRDEKIRQLMETNGQPKPCNC